MTKITRNFIAGRMNKSVDERLVPQGEYIDAMNVRLGSTEASEIGAVENSAGNTVLTALEFGGQPLSATARCIGAFEDGSNETIYWFVHDNANPVAATGKCDLVVSFDVKTSSTTYHLVSIDDGGGARTTLNFNPTYLITGVNKVDDFLLWTDDFNEPRRINVLSGYPLPALGVDQITNEMINVIVKPPTLSTSISLTNTTASPTIELLNLPGEENYMETRFIAFAYRYKYENGEYSALSQFSDVAFEPGNFEIDVDNFINGSMINNYNSVRVTFNTGGPLVKAIDLCFKYADNTIIKIIEKYDKSEEGWADNILETITFSNSKIYTVLPEGEILRLYDNVPLLAKAQTIMGNRLMYGNYVDGYDLIDYAGFPCMQTFVTTLDSQNIGLVEVAGTTFTQDYYFTSPSGAPFPMPAVVPSGRADFDLSLIANGAGFKKGATLTFIVQFSHRLYTGNDICTPLCPAPTSPFTVEWTITFQQDYTNVYDLETSTEWTSMIGDQSCPGLPCNIQTVPDCALGNTVTDAYNCAVLAPAGFTKIESGINGAGESVTTSNNLATNEIRVIFLSMRYEVTGVPASNDAYQLFSVSGCSWIYSEFGNKKSLHSNRDFETAIIYMDDYNRATTALVSEFNTIDTPCFSSNQKNRIQVRLPVDMAPPYWATKYKWACKPSETTYETIYVILFYVDPFDSSVWMRLEGENQLKVEVGDILRVKKDVNGALDTCVDTSVLDKVVQERDFLGTPGSQEPGTYMKLKPNGYSAAAATNAFIDGGTDDVTTKEHSERIEDASGCDCYPWMKYPLYDTVGGVDTPWEVNAGAIVNVYIRFWRPARGCQTSCGAVEAIFELNHQSSQDYTNMYDFWIGEGINIPANIDSGPPACEDDSGPNLNSFDPYLYDSAVDPASLDSTAEAIQGTNLFQFHKNTAGPDERMWLSLVGGTKYCTGTPRKHSTIECRFTVQNSDAMLVFETPPIDAQPDIFFIGSQTYDILVGGGGVRSHQCNVTNQDIGASIQGESLLEFFDCYAFGNGVESYKIEDSLTGQYFLLGQQTTAVAAQDYKEADRYADITYSGVFNNESNVNRLNEFNLGLFNFKPCEESFGPIQILSGRETDVLTLQEDKISYVLAGKNLLSDAAAGGAITSVPEVLGTQIARIEEFGISHNPESFIQWGQDNFFSDVKRGAVLQLKGGGRTQQLLPISEQGMRSWFRDLFNTSFNTQKLGAYDPYMNEYVFSSNDRDLPLEIPCLPCDFQTTYLLNPATPVVFCVELGPAVGSWTITYELSDPVPETLEISVDYDSVITTTGVLNPAVNGTLTIGKPTTIPTEAIVTMESTGSTIAEVTLTVSCLDTDGIVIVPVCVTSDGDAGEFIHNQWRWTQGSFNSAFGTRAVGPFLGGTGNVISDYDNIPAIQGIGYCPPPGPGVTVSLVSNKILPDNFVFDPTSDRMGFYQTAILLNNTPADMDFLLANADFSAAPVNIGPDEWQSQYLMGLAPTPQFLYLIWDYRTINGIQLCYSNLSEYDACCDCDTCEDCNLFTGTVLDTSLIGSCALPRATQYFWNGTGSEPEIGDVVYTDNLCDEIVVAPSGAWIGIGPVNSQGIYIDATATITVKSPCT